VEYTTLGRTGLEVSRLGFGCMRLPMKEGRVDRDLSTPMLRRAYELGINFFDTAVGYCGADSQPAVGEALEPIRDKVIISTKNHLHNAKPDEWRRALEDSLRFLRTDHIDVYNHHGVRWAVFTERLDPEKGGLTAEMIRAKDEGLIRHIGISFHDTPENLIKLAATGYYESVILQYNLLDQANAEAMHKVAEMGVGIIVMGPVGGGRLGIPSEKIVELTGGAVKSTPEAAFRFVWAHPAVNMALSGMQTMEMLEENVAIAENSEPFTVEQTERINSLVKERLERSGLYCTACGYCLETCPADVQIPNNLELLNMARIYGLTGPVRGRYRGLRGKAIRCVACGVCIEKCPQNIDIPARLRDTVLTLDPDAGKVVVQPFVGEVTSDGKFELAFKVRNVSDQERDVSVTLEAGGDVEVAEPCVSFEGVEPFGRAKGSFEGTFPAQDRRLSLALKVSYDGESATTDFDYSFLMLDKGLPAAWQGDLDSSPDDLWQGDGWLEITATEDDFSAAKDTAGLHGCRFKLAYDDAGLLLLADVRDDLLCPAGKEKADESADCIELFLDGRKSRLVGKPRYEDGVHQVFLHPGVPGDTAAFAKSKSKIDVKLWSVRTDEGYRLAACIPFSEFCLEDGVPAKIGFELAVDTADSDGKRIGQYVFAGGPNNWRDASLFREVWLR